MNITNPTTFGIPGLTLTTSNVEGTGNAIRTGASILAFDATDPAAVSASASVGSAVVASRRDHVHSGMGGAGTVVDEAITRFNGTGGASLQGYSSLSPTISDAGIISLPSGALKFPATAIASADANTLDDYQEGSWTPRLMDSDLDSGDENVEYTVRVGRFVRIGPMVWAQFSIEISTLGDLSTGSNSFLGGLPFPSENTANNSGGGPVFYAASLGISAGQNLTLAVYANQAYANIQLWDWSGGTTTALISELSSDANFRGHVIYRAA